MGYAISSKGQVTLPASAREQIGVGPGDEIDYFFEEGQLVVRPVRTEENPFEKWVGALNPKGAPKGTAVAWVRSLRDAEFDSDHNSEDKE